MDIKPIKDWGMNFPTDQPLIIAGPCSAETKEQTLASCRGAAKAGAHILRAGIWKPRTNPGSFEGIGEEGLPWMQQAKRETGLPTTVEVANAHHVRTAMAHGIDILWIGARTTVNPFAVQEIADALKYHDIPVMVKNPINPDVKLWAGAIKRLHAVGVKRVAAIHRGFNTLAQKDVYRNPPHWGLALELKKLVPGINIIGDPSHTGGKRELLWSISKKGLDIGFDGLMIETHTDPDNAWSDAAQQVTPVDLAHLLDSLLNSDKAPRTDKASTELHSWRAEIDLLDQSLINLLKQRKEIVEQIAEFKQENKIPIVQLGRWKEMMRKRLEAGGNQGLNEQLVSGIFDAIHQDSVSYQREITSSQPADV